MKKLVYFGPQWTGSTSLQRLNAFKKLIGVQAIGVDCGASPDSRSTLWNRVRWKLRLPADVREENSALIEAATFHRPDIIVVDNSKVISRSTVVALRRMGVRRLVYYSPDDLAARHNLSFPLKWSLSEWDIVCTTKTFNIPELRSMGVQRPYLIGKAYDSEIHKPWSQDQVGSDFERFDVVFIGTHERERCSSINALAEAGVSVVVYGADKGNWKRRNLHASIILRNSVFGEEYVRAWHVGKIALCFLRKINRDRITQRTMEIAAIGRPMVAERTDEHDSHFSHGSEYLGFIDDKELISQVAALLADPTRRQGLGASGRARCQASGYSTMERARQMMEEFSK